MKNVEDLFEAMVAKAKSVNAARGDGLAFWQRFKPLLDKSRLSFEWRSRWSDELSARILDMAEYVTTGRGEKKIVKNNHFLIQAVRIPKTEDPCLRKLIQVALNVGQHSAEPTLVALPKTHSKCHWYVESALCKAPLADALDPDAIKALGKLLARPSPQKQNR